MKRLLMIFSILCLCGTAGCINTPDEAEDCFSMEQRRCEMRGRCYDGFDVEGCKYYYKEQCRARRIVPSYTENELTACLTQLDHFGENDDVECNALIKLDKALKPELCELSALDACRPLACPEAYEDSEESSDDDSDSGIPQGLDP